MQIIYKPLNFKIMTIKELKEKNCSLTIMKIGGSGHFRILECYDAKE
jgi:hypothetical protein